MLESQSQFIEVRAKAAWRFVRVRARALWLAARCWKLTRELRAKKAEIEKAHANTGL